MLDTVNFLVQYSVEYSAQYSVQNSLQCTVQYSRGAWGFNYSTSEDNTCSVTLALNPSGSLFFCPKPDNSEEK